MGSNLDLLVARRDWTDAQDVLRQPLRRAGGPIGAQKSPTVLLGGQRWRTGLKNISKIWVADFKKCGSPQLDIRPPLNANCLDPSVQRSYSRQCLRYEILVEVRERRQCHNIREDAICDACLLS